MLLIGGDEDDGEVGHGCQLLQHLEAVAFGHLHVEEDDVGLERGDGGQRLCAGAALADDLYIAIAREQGDEVAARQRFVVDDQRTQGGASFHHAVRYGSDIEASTPPGAWLRSVNAEASP